MAAKKKTRKKKVASPAPASSSGQLYWNEERDATLVRAIRESVEDHPRASSIAEALAETEEFAGVDINGAKVSRRAAKLRSLNVEIPNFGRTRYSPDVDALNDLLD